MWIIYTIHLNLTPCLLEPYVIWDALHRAISSWLTAFPRASCPSALYPDSKWIAAFDPRVCQCVSTLADLGHPQDGQPLSIPQLLLKNQSCVGLSHGNTASWDRCEEIVTSVLRKGPYCSCGIFALNKRHIYCKGAGLNFHGILSAVTDYCFYKGLCILKLI